jgi:hypothetical protein
MSDQTCSACGTQVAPYDVTLRAHRHNSLQDPWHENPGSSFTTLFRSERAPTANGNGTHRDFGIRANQREKRMASEPDRWVFSVPELAYWHPKRTGELAGKGCVSGQERRKLAREFPVVEIVRVKALR